MANITNITPPRVPFLDASTGNISREWYRFFLNQFQLTGSGRSDITIADVQLAPSSSDSSVIQMIDELRQEIALAPINGTSSTSSSTDGTWTPTFTNLTTVSGTPVWTASYVKTGRIVYATMKLSGGAVSSVANSTYFTLPFTAGVDGAVLNATDANVGGFGVGLVQGLYGFPPTFTNKTLVVITAVYITS